jgi:structural maintenance of chromosome 1
LTTELERIQTDLHEAKADRKQSERETKYSEAVESLKRLFSGVYGRLTDLAKIAKKYRLAVTVAAGGSMDAIIVEDEKTAMECIRVLYVQLENMLI